MGSGQPSFHGLLLTVSFVLMMTQLFNHVQANIVNQCAPSHGQYYYRHDYDRQYYNLCCPCPPPGTEAKEGTQCQPPSHQAGGPPGYWLEEDLQPCVSGTFRTGEGPCDEPSMRKCQPCTSHSALIYEQTRLPGSVIAPCTREADAKVGCPQLWVVYDYGAGNVCFNCLECCYTNQSYCYKCAVMEFECPTTMTTTTTTPSTPTTTSDEDLFITSTEPPTQRQDAGKSTVSNKAVPRNAHITGTSNDSSTADILLPIVVATLLLIAGLLSYIACRYKKCQGPAQPYKDPRSTDLSASYHQTSDLNSSSPLALGEQIPTHQ